MAALGFCEHGAEPSVFMKGREFFFLVVEPPSASQETAYFTNFVRR
jgi:hypothetical protein